MRSVISIHVADRQPIEQVILFGIRADDVTPTARPTSFDLDVIVHGVPLAMRGLVGAVAVTLYRQLTGCEPAAVNKRIEAAPAEFTLRNPVPLANDAGGRAR